MTKSPTQTVSNCVWYDFVGSFITCFAVCLFVRFALVALIGTLGWEPLVPVDWQRWAMGISTSIDVSIASFLIDSNFEQNTKHFESYSDHWNFLLLSSLKKMLSNQGQLPMAYLVLDWHGLYETGNKDCAPAGNPLLVFSSTKVSLIVRAKSWSCKTAECAILMACHGCARTASTCWSSFFASCPMRMLASCCSLGLRDLLVIETSFFAPEGCNII